MCALLVLFPLYLLVMVSVAPGAAIFGERPALWVSDPTLKFWARVVERGDLWGPLAKSFVVACLTTLIAVVLAAPGAYVIARLPAGPRYALAVALLVTRMFPEFAVGVSVATRFAQLGLTDTYAGLALAHLTGVLPFIAWLLVGAFEGVPRDVEAAAAVPDHRAERPTNEMELVLDDEIRWTERRNGLHLCRRMDPSLGVVA